MFYWLNMVRVLEEGGEAVGVGCGVFLVTRA